MDRFMKVVLSVLIVFGGGLSGVSAEELQDGGQMANTGLVQSVSLAKHTLRIAGEVYRVPAEAEISDLQEGGTMSMRSIRVGSRVRYTFHRLKGESFPVIDQVEILETPLK